MAFLTVLIALVGVLGLLVTALLFAVLRRLREYGAELDQLRALVGAGTLGGSGALLGRPFPALPGARPELVGFFSVGCPACHTQAPLFEAEAAGRPAVAVVIGEAAEAAGLAEAFDAGLTVVTGPESGRLAAELGVTTYPTFVRLGPDGTVVRAQHQAPGLAELATA